MFNKKRFLTYSMSLHVDIQSLRLHWHQIKFNSGRNQKPSEIRRLAGHFSVNLQPRFSIYDRQIHNLKRFFTFFHIFHIFHCFLRIPKKRRFFKLFENLQESWLEPDRKEVGSLLWFILGQLKSKIFRKKNSIRIA